VADRTLLDRMTVDPKLCFGEPCIRDHRIWVSMIRDKLACGIPMAEILADHPGLVEDDIRVRVAYGTAKRG
jgi:uncharacterized protein (DUF433 family)